MTKFFILFFFLSFGLYSQKSTPRDSLKRTGVSFYDKVIYHDGHSKLPGTLSIHGTIIDIAYGQCGVRCSGGVIKVKLIDLIPEYPDSLVYIVTACLVPEENESDYIGLDVNVTASKLTRKDTACYYKSVDNTIGSNGIPFYKLSETETHKIIVKR